MTPDQLIAARQNYSYVPACLIASTEPEPELIWGTLRLVRQLPSYGEWNSPEVRSRYASVKLDAHHMALLNGDAEDALLHGLASTMFWGYASGANGLFHIDFAIAKTKTLANGRLNIPAQATIDILRHLRAANSRLRAGDTAGALLEAMCIKFLGMSFASKIVMFMDPSRAVVYDAIIAERLSGSSNPTLRAMAVSTSASTNRDQQARAYGQWCAYCSEAASAMNLAGRRWKDWDNLTHLWRSVDVERAFFTLGR